MEQVLARVQTYNIDDYTIAVFGAGNTAVLYKKCFIKEGIDPVYYIDNNPAKKNTFFQGKPVISLEELLIKQKEWKKPFLILICTANIYIGNQIKDQLKKNNLLFSTVDELVFSVNKDKILQIYDYLVDDISKETYTKVVQSRIENTAIPENMVFNNQYFALPEFSYHYTGEREVFVDLGAYTGDSLEQYINKKMGVFNKIFAFEPEEHNFNAMSYRVSRLKNEWAISDDKLITVNAGVGIKTGKIFLSTPSEGVQSSGSSARLGANFASDKKDGSKEITIYALDDYFKDQRVGFIKADIESYELDMLQGAVNIIKRDNPLLAICIYHNASDIYSIPLFIKKLNPEYKLKIRQHTYVSADTVLYAYI